MMAIGQSASTRIVVSAGTRIALVCLAVACSPPVRPPGTAVIASGTDLESGNPAVTVHTLTRQLQRHALFVTLTRLDSAFVQHPYLARRWEWDAASRVLRMTLVDDLQWHDGAPTTADDVAFTFRAIRDSAVGSPRAADVAAIDSAVADDPRTVRFFFARPQVDIPVVFAELPVLPQHLLDTVSRTRWRASAFATSPVGNGPFRFVSREAGRRWVFARNAAFPVSMGGPPRLERLVVAVVDEASTKFAGLVSGALDMAGVSPTMANLVRRDRSLRLVTPPALFSTVLVFNTARAPFDDASVRRAISLGLDRRRIVAAAVAGFGTPAAGAIPPGLPMSDAAAPREDVTRADSLLDARGWRRGASGVRVRNGSRLAFTLITVGSGDMAIEQLVAADLRARGIAVEIRVLEAATFLSTLRADPKTFDVALTGIPGDVSLNSLRAMFATPQRGGALDYAGYHRAVLDTLFQRAVNAPPSTRSEAWRMVNESLLDSMPVAWVYHARGVQGLSRRLRNVEMDLRGELTSVPRWEVGNP